MDVAVLNCCVTDTKRDPVLVEGFHHLGEVQQRAAEAIDFVDDHAINVPAAMSASRRCSAGRSMLPPVKPPSS